MFNNNYIIPGPSTAPVQIGSGGVASGSFGSASVVSGVVASGAVTGQAGGGYFGIASGTVTTNDLGSGAVNSGQIASGQVGTYHLGSGAVSRAAQFVTMFQSGTAWSLITEEIISGVRAVQVSQSGRLRVAMASVSGRMPAMGVVIDNVLSGIPANVYQMGLFQVASGMADFSGWLGTSAWVGRSGQVVQWSGGFNSGGFNTASGGDFVQRAGIIVNSGAFAANVDATMLQNQLITLSQFIDSVDRRFGV